MKSKIKKLAMFGVIFILLLEINIATEKNRIYRLDLNYDRGVFTSKGVIVRQGFAPDRNVQPKVGYKAEVVSFDSKILDSFRFSIPLTIYTDRIDPETGQMTGETIQLNETDFSLRINYFKNGKMINIYDPQDNKVLSVDVSPFADVCGDGICQGHENYKNCPQDCPSGSKDNYCDKREDTVCDPDCSPHQDPDCEKKGGFGILSYVGILFIVIIFIIFLFFYKKSKQKEKETIEKKREEFGEWKEMKEKVK